MVPFVRRLILFLSLVLVDTFVSRGHATCHPVTDEDAALRFSRVG